MRFPNERFLFIAKTYPGEGHLGVYRIWGDVLLDHVPLNYQAACRADPAWIFFRMDLERFTGPGYLNVVVDPATREVEGSLTPLFEGRYPAGPAEPVRFTYRNLEEVVARRDALD